MRFVRGKHLEGDGLYFAVAEQVRREAHIMLKHVHSPLQQYRLLKGAMKVLKNVLQPSAYQTTIVSKRSHHEQGLPKKQMKSGVPPSLED